jgi:glutaredoxin
MIRVIGNLNCPNCHITKMTLEKKGVDFTYEIFDQLSKDEQEILLEEAKNKGFLKMPLILKDNQLTTITEL